MADYVFTILSRPVKTKNNDEFVKVFLGLGFEESQVIGDTAWVGSYGEAYWDDDSMIVVKEKATGNVIGGYNTYGGYETLEAFLEGHDIPKEAVESYEEIDIETYIKSMLLDGQAFIITEAGNEKLRYNNGWGLIITKDDVVSYDINLLIDKYLEDKGLLGK